MNPIKIGLIVLLNFILQGTILPFLSIAGIVPNTALILVIAFTLIAGKETGAVVAIAAGFLQDIFYSEVIGINAITLFAIALMVGSLDKKVFKENLILPVAITIVATFAHYIIQFFFVYFLGVDINILDLMGKYAVKEIIYNGLISILIYRAILRSYKEPTVRFTKAI